MAVFTTIDDAGSFFSPKLYTGNGTAIGSGGNAITGVGFQPDVTWLKNRDAADFHNLYDAVRGATKFLETNDGLEETTNAESLTSFDSDGFTVGSYAQSNTNTEDYVSWNWKMGTTTGIAGSPSITPDGYSFNATAGQSIIEFSGNGVAGATLPHGLGVAPKMIIVKRTDSATFHWGVYHVGIDVTAPEDYYLLLNTDAGRVDQTDFWNDTAPTTTLFYLGDNTNINNSSGTYIAYCFAAIPGFSAFGMYTGNGKADGPFVYTGFRPAWVMIKVIDSGDPKHWELQDNLRVGYNTDNNSLRPDTTAAESTDTTLDLVSNGFKLRRADDTLNNVAFTYTYSAFAYNPFVNSSGVAGNAR